MSPLRRLSTCLSALLPASARLVLLCGLCATFPLFILVSRLETQQEELRLRELAQRRFIAIRNGTEGVLAALRSVNQLFSAVGNVTHEQFHAYAQPLLRDHPGVMALGYQRLVRAEERADYEKRMQARVPLFQIVEPAPGGMVRAGDRGEYRVIEYIEPIAGNELVLGLDSAMLAAHNEAVLQSRRTGQPRATPLFALPQDMDSNRGHGFLVFAPVHAQPGVRESPATGAVTGYNVAVFRSEELFEQIMLAAGIPEAQKLALSVHELEASGAGMQADRAEIHNECARPCWQSG